VDVMIEDYSTGLDIVIRTRDYFISESKEEVFDIYSFSYPVRSFIIIEGLVKESLASSPI
jgi:hypothetical protein